MADYGRDWSYRRVERPYRGRYHPERMGYGREFSRDFSGRRTRRGPGRHFTGFRREPGIEEGFGYGAGVGYAGEMEYGPERGMRRRMRSYPIERGYRGEAPGYEIERGYGGRRRGLSEGRGGRQGYRRGPRERGIRGETYYGEEFYYDQEMMGYGPGGGYAEGYFPEDDFASVAGRMEPRYGHTPVDRWPERGHDLDHLEREEMEMGDGEIREAVLENLFQDNWINPERIDVHVDGGVVTLAGEVRDFMEARYAWDDAWESAGVRGVINNLTVRADLPQEGMEFPQTS